MSDTRWKLFSYLLIDHKAAQADLNAMAEQGWELETIWNELPFAKFRRTDRTDLRYFVDWSNTAKPEESEYLQLCRDAGWELVHTQGYCNIYASAPGASPLPIQTDSAVEYQRYRKKILRRIAIVTPIPFLPLIVYWIWMATTFKGLFSFPSPSQLATAFFLSSNALSVFLFSIPLLIPLCLIYAVCMIRQLFVWNRAIKNSAFPEVNVSAARRRGLITLFIRICALLLLFLLLADYALNGIGNLGFPIGLLIGCFIRWGMYEDSRIRRETLKVAAIGVAILVCGLAQTTVRDAVPSRLPVGPVFAENTRLEEADRTDTFLGSKISWEEYLSSSKAPNKSSAIYTFTVRTWISPALAQLDMADDLSKATPVPGLENTWQLPSRWNIEYYLLRRGNTWMKVSYQPDYAEQSPLPAAAAWLEQHS